MIYSDEDSAKFAIRDMPLSFPKDRLEDLERLKREKGIVSDGKHEFAEWIGIDLDGTLAEYHGWVDVDVIGKPIPAMVEFVKRLLAEGKRVKIFTARALNPDSIEPIRDWLWRNGLPDLEITNVKDYGMVMLYDDRARQVEFNTGRIIGG